MTIVKSVHEVTAMSQEVTQEVRGVFKACVKNPPGDHLSCSLYFNFMIVCKSVPVASLCDAIYSMRVFQ